MKQLVIFDLDGTLLNTIEDLAASCNAILEQRGMECYDLASYESFVGNGIMRLVERIIPPEMRSEEFIAEIRHDFLEYYTANISTFTTIYAGMSELIEELAARGHHDLQPKDRSYLARMELPDHY